MEMKKLGLGTTAIHAGTLKNLYGTLAMPIYQTSTFIFDSAEQRGSWSGYVIWYGSYIFNIVDCLKSW